jgi:histidinol-phosphatase (PHP family)
MFDYHVHTNLSFDGTHQMDFLVEKAIFLGIRQLCLTDHIDYDYDGEGNDFSFSYQSYFSELARVRKKYHSQIDIRAGVEFGLQPHNIDRYRADADAWPFDYIIGSCHSAKKTDIYTGPYFENRSQQQAYDDYFDDMYQIVEQNAPLSVIGHYDMIKRYGSFDHTLPLSDFRDITVNIFKKLIEQGKGIEVNTSGFRYKLGDAHPSMDILALYKEVGGEIIVPGSDAHLAEEIGYGIKDVLQNLDNLGFRYVSTFKDLKPEFHLISRLL